MCSTKVESNLCDVSAHCTEYSNAKYSQGSIVLTWISDYMKKGFHCKQGLLVCCSNLLGVYELFMTLSKNSLAGHDFLAKGRIRVVGTHE